MLHGILLQYLCFQFNILSLVPYSEVDTTLHTMQQTKKDSHEVALRIIGGKRKGLVNMENSTKVIIGRMGQEQV